MAFGDFVKDANAKSATVNSAPRPRQLQQAGIDAVNHAALPTENTAFEDVESILEGNTTARKFRGISLEDLCAALLAPSEIPSQSHASLAVSISPNSADLGANQATVPIIIPIAAFGGANIYEPIAQLNISRQRLTIQNVGLGNLFIVYGKASQYGGNVTTVYHLKIAPGDTFFDEQWQGRIDVASDTGTSISVIEFSRAQNVSQ